MKRFSMVILVVLALTTPSTAQFRVDISKALDAVSPIMYDSDGKVDWVFSSMLITQNAMSAADLFISRSAVDRGAHEGNPIMRFGMENRPLDIAIKVVLGGIGNYCQKEIYRREPTTGYVFTAVITGGWVWLVNRNYHLSLQIPLEE